MPVDAGVRSACSRTTAAPLSRLGTFAPTQAISNVGAIDVSTRHGVRTGGAPKARAERGRTAAADRTSCGTATVGSAVWTAAVGSSFRTAPE
jgi:hypothetical protein